MIYKLHGLTDEEIAIIEGHRKSDSRSNRRPRRLANRVMGCYAGVSKATVAKKQAMIVTDPG
jgi:hypothetical protein